MNIENAGALFDEAAIRMSLILIEVAPQRH